MKDSTNKTAPVFTPSPLQTLQQYNEDTRVDLSYSHMQLEDTERPRTNLYLEDKTYTWPVNQLEKIFNTQSPEYFEYKKVIIPEQIKRRKLKGSISLLWKAQLTGDINSAFRVVIIPADGSPDIIWRPDFDLQREYLKCEAELPQHFVDMVRGNDAISFQFVVGQSYNNDDQLSNLNESFLNKSNLKKSDPEFYEIFLRNLTFIYSGDLLWDINQHLDTEAFTSRAYFPGSEGGERKLFEIDLSQNNILGVKSVTLSFMESETDQIFIDLIRAGEIRYQKKLKIDDSKVVLDEDDELLESWKQNDLYIVKYQGSNLSLAEASYKVDAIRIAKRQTEVPQFELPEKLMRGLYDTKSDTLVDHLIQNLDKVNHLQTPQDIDDKYEIDLSAGQNISSVVDVRDDNFSGPCICGPVQIAYVNREARKLVVTNNFFSHLSPRSEQVTLARQEDVTFLTYTLIADIPMFLIGYRNGLSIIRHAKNFQILFKSELIDENIVKCIDHHADPVNKVLYLSILKVKEVDGFEKYHLAQYLLPLPKEKEVVSKVFKKPYFLYESDKNMMHRRQIKYCNLLKIVTNEKSSFLVHNYLEAESTINLALVDLNLTCSSGEIQQPVFLPTNSEASNVFFIQDSLLVVTQNRVMTFIRGPDNTWLLKKHSKPTKTIITGSLVSAEKLIIGTAGSGLFTFEVDNLEENPVPLAMGSFLKLCMSGCGRFFVAGGVNQVLFYETGSMSKLGILDAKNQFCKDVLIQSSELVFLKMKTGWHMINVLENNFSISLKGKSLLLNDSYSRYLHLISSREDFKPHSTFGIKKQGKTLVCESLLTDHILELLSEEAAEDGWEAQDFSVIKGNLTWLILNRQKSACEVKRIYYVDYLLGTKKDYEVKSVAVPLTNSDFKLSLISQEKEAFLLDTGKNLRIDFEEEKYENQKYSQDLAENIYLAQSNYQKINDKVNRYSENFRLYMNNKNVVIQTSPITVEVAQVGREKFEKRRPVLDKVNFAQVCFMPGFFAAQKLVAGKEQWGIYSIQTGELLCTFFASEFQFLRPSTIDEGRFPRITGIVDKRTLKLYPVCVKTLLHLNAEQVHLSADELVHEEDLKPSFKVEVLGLPTPIFFGEQVKNNINKVKDLKDKIFHSIVWCCRHKDPAMSEKPAVEAQNMLHYLVHHDLDKKLAGWLIDDKSNYLETGKTPVTLLQQQCARTILHLFRYYKKQNKFSIFEHIEHKEIAMLLRFEELSVDFFDLFATTILFPFTNKKRAHLNTKWKIPIENVISLNELQDNKTQQRLSKQFFVDDEDEDKEPKAYEGQVIMCKFNLERGSEGSMALINEIDALDDLSEVYTSKTIQKLIEYKYEKIKFISYLYLTQYLLFMLQISFSHDANQVLFFAIFQLFLEAYELLASCSNQVEDIWEHLTDLWNWIDVLRIVTALGYCITTFKYEQNPDDVDNFVYRAQFFSFLQFFSWLGLLQYCRFSKQLSNFLTLVVSTLAEMQIPLGLFFYLTLTFVNTQYFYIILTNQSNRETGYNQMLLNQIMNAFGEFVDYAEFSFTESFFFLVSTFLILFLVLNLAIAQMSDTHERWKENKIKNQYRLRLNVVKQMESLLIWKRGGVGRFCSRGGKQADSEERHLIFVDHEDQDPREITLAEVGRQVKAAVKKEAKKQKKQLKAMKEQLDKKQKEVDHKLVTIQLTLDLLVKSESDRK